MAMNTSPDRPEPRRGFDGVGATADDVRLACGRMLSGVWAAWEDGASDAHVRTCPHCEQAVHGLKALGAAVRAAHGEPGQDWDLSPLTERIMDVVRLELRPGRPLPLGEREEDVWVMEAMAAKSLRAAAERLPGVCAGSCRIQPGASDGDGPARGPVQVGLEVVVPLTTSLPHLAEQIRRQVHLAADTTLGLPVESIDIRITDLTVPDVTATTGAENRTAWVQPERDGSTSRPTAGDLWGETE
jgi:hypothetical protein